MSDASAIQSHLTDVRARIARAAGRVNRDPASIRLVAVSKTFSADAVRAAAAAGQIDFGENKVQEALGKMDQTADLPIRWHLIGHLQSNKARKAAARFDAIQSVDSVNLLQRLQEAADTAGRQLEALVQVDLAGETTKYGASEEALLPIFEEAARSQAVRLAGLMIIPPAVDDPEAARPYFRDLVGVRARLMARGVDQSHVEHLSMGMSHDFEVAVEEGATIVRVGTAIFGSRTYV